MSDIDEPRQDLVRAQVFSLALAIASFTFSQLVSQTFLFFTKNGKRDKRAFKFVVISLFCLGTASIGLTIAVRFCFSGKPSYAMLMQKRCSKGRQALAGPDNHDRKPAGNG